MTSVESETAKTSSDGTVPDILKDEAEVVSYFVSHGWFKKKSCGISSWSFAEKLVITGLVIQECR